MPRPSPPRPPAVVQRTLRGHGPEPRREYSTDSPEAEALLAEQGLSSADLERALVRFETTEGTTVRTIVGINEDGVFGTSREGWRPDLPDAGHQSFIPLLWIRVLKLLGRVPEGSTARFCTDGTLRSDVNTTPGAYRIAAERVLPKH